MIIQENIGDGFVRTYSNIGVYIHGGYPEADYEDVIDPISEGRTYVETDRPIVSTEPTDEEYAEIGRILMGVE